MNNQDVTCGRPGQTAAKPTPAKKQKRSEILPSATLGIGRVKRTGPHLNSTDPYETVVVDMPWPCDSIARRGAMLYGKKGRGLREDHDAIGGQISINVPTELPTIRAIGGLREKRDQAKLTPDISKGWQFMTNLQSNLFETREAECFRRRKGCFNFS